MWSVFNDSDLFLITVNSTLKTNGNLVMGRGIAKEAKDRFPILPVIAGAYLEKAGLDQQFFGIARQLIPGNPIGLFQVKHHYRSDATLNLIKESSKMLANILSSESDLSRVHLNAPGIGNGRLNTEPVFKLIGEILGDYSDRLTIWIK